MLRISNFKKNGDSFLAAVAGFTMILLLTHHGGIGISPDSVVYSTAAEHLAKSGRFTDFTGQPVINFPILYPALLSLIIVTTGLKAAVFGAYLNALLFAMLVFFAGTITERFARSTKWYKLAILSCIVFSPALLEDYSMLWSETIFILLLLVFIDATRRYLEIHSVKSLVFVAVIAAVACATRYAGVTIVATGGLILLADATLPIRRKVIHVLLFAIISPALFVLNVIRNHLVSGTLTGFREKSLTSFKQNLRDTGETFCDWLPFFHTHKPLAIGVVLTVLFALISVCVGLFVLRKRIANYVGISAAFSFIYILFMVITATLSRFEELNSRFMSPAFIPLIWSGSYWLCRLPKNMAINVKRLVVIGGAVLFIAFEYNQLAANYETWNNVKDDGIPGYTDDDWIYSDTVQYIELDSLPFKKNYAIYSDEPEAVYFFLGRAANYLPHKDFVNEEQQFLKDRNCYVVWFSNEEDTDLVGLQFIIDRKKMRLLKQFSDGAIYGTEE